jgi:hypothetical protein
MTLTIEFEPYVGSSVDALSIPLYLRCQLVFKLSKPLTVVPLLESGVKRLIQALPFLSGEFTTVPASDDGKEILLVRPAPNFELGRIFKIERHGTSLQDVFDQMDEPSGQGGDLPHEPYMPYPRFPDPSRPQPIVGFQVNVHRDGVILSVATHHCAFDATGMGSIVRNLAACCRHEPDLTTSPGEEAKARKVLSQIRETPFDPKMFPEYRPLDSLLSYYKGARSALQSRQTTIVNRCFTIAADKINALKKRCNGLIPEMKKKYGLSTQNDTESAWVSSNDVVAALLWACINRARYPELRERSLQQLPPDLLNATSSLGLPVNIRSRMSPPLPKSSLGNAVCLLREKVPLHLFALPGHDNVANMKASAHFPSDYSEGDEWAMAFCRVAYGLRAKLNTIDYDYICDYISYVQKSPCHLSVTLDTENLYLSNWREIGVYDADFGGALGKPLRMRAPDGYTDGLIFVMAQRSDDKTAPWEFSMSLESSTMKRIVNDPLWCKYVELDGFWHGAS